MKKENKLKQAIENFDYADSDITQENFPYEPIRGKVVIKHYDNAISGEDVIAEMAKENLVPANLYELLEYAQDGWNNENNIVALGSSWVDPDGYRYVPFLGLWDDERKLDLDWFDCGWGGGCRFAAVHLEKGTVFVEGRIGIGTTAPEADIHVVCDNCGHEMKYNYDTETEQGTVPVEGTMAWPKLEKCCCLIDNHCEHCPNYGIEDREAVDDTCYDEDCPMSYKYHSTKEYSCESNSPEKPNSSVYGIDREKLEGLRKWYCNLTIDQLLDCLVPVQDRVEDRVEEMITEVGAFEPRLPGWEKVIEELMNEYVTKTQSEYQEKLLHFERFYKEYAKTQYEAGIYDERERWINQPANEHDNKIRNEAYEKAAMLAFHELVKPCGTTMANTVANHIRNLKKQKR